MTDNIDVAITMYTVVGLSAGGRVVIGVNYLTEFIETKNQNIVITALNCGDASLMLWQSIYWYIAQTWWPLHIYGFIFAVVIITIVAMNVPESPKWFYAN